MIHYMPLKSVLSIGAPLLVKRVLCMQSWSHQSRKVEANSSMFWDKVTCKRCLKKRVKDE